jgi:hypothetical protein
MECKPEGVGSRGPSKLRNYELKNSGRSQDIRSHGG